MRFPFFGKKTKSKKDSLINVSKLTSFFFFGLWLMPKLNTKNVAFFFIAVNQNPVNTFKAFGFIQYQQKLPLRFPE